MAKADLKTKKTAASVDDFLNGIADEQKRTDCKAIVSMMKKATGAAPKMWGPAIIGFGDTHLKYESGRELDWFKIGFSPRKQNISLYGLGANSNAALLKQLGKCKSGAGCLYINRLADIDLATLQDLMNLAAQKK